ncbi:alpha/beta hydrolase, partial [Salmonella enterica]
KNGNEIIASLYPTKLRHSKAPTNPTVAKYVKNFLYETP